MSAGRRTRPWPVAAVLLGAVAAGTGIRAYDFFWHLAAGRWIAENGAVPRTDPFSFTAAGVPWVDHEWLYQLVAWIAWSRLGALGPWLLKVGLGGALAAVLWRHLARSGVPVLAALLTLAACLGGAAPRLTDRPEMASLLFAALAAGCLCRPPRPDGGGWAPLWIAPLAALWANIHPGAILAPLLLGAALAGTALEAILVPARRAAAPRRLAVLGIALPCAIAGLLFNPYGPAILAVPFRLTAIVGQDWAPNREWLRPGLADAPAVYLAVAGLAAAATVRWRRLSGPALAVGLLGALLALRYVRNQGIFFVLLPFALAPLLAWDDVLARVRPAATAALAAVAVFGFVAAPPQGRFGPGLEPGRFPAQACDFVERAGVDGRMFNEVAHGGYLLWRFPDRRVFVDGRNEVYTALLPEVFAALADPARFWQLTRGWDLTAAMVRFSGAAQMVQYRTPDGGARRERRAWSAVYFPRPEWALVHWDDVAMVWVRRARFAPEWLARHEYPAIHPDDWPHQQRALAGGEVDPGPLRADLERKLRDDPGCERARDLLARLTTTVETLTGPGGPPAGR